MRRGKEKTGADEELSEEQKRKAGQTDRQTSEERRNTNKYYERKNNKEISGDNGCFRRSRLSQEVYLG